MGSGTRIPEPFNVIRVQVVVGTFYHIPLDYGVSGIKLKVERNRKIRMPVTVDLVLHEGDVEREEGRKE